MTAAVRNPEPLEEVALLLGKVLARLSEIDAVPEQAGRFVKTNDLVRELKAELLRDHGARFWKNGRHHRVRMAGVEAGSTVGTLFLLRRWCMEAQRRIDERQAA